MLYLEATTERHSLKYVFFKSRQTRIRIKNNDTNSDREYLYHHHHHHHHHHHLSNIKLLH